MLSDDDLIAWRGVLHEAGVPADDLDDRTVVMAGAFFLRRDGTAIGLMDCWFENVRAGRWEGESVSAIHYGHATGPIRRADRGRLVSFVLGKPVVAEILVESIERFRYETRATISFLGLLAAAGRPELARAALHRRVEAARLEAAAT